jgi:hypothetical protein
MESEKIEYVTCILNQNTVYFPQIFLEWMASENMSGGLWLFT